MAKLGRNRVIDRYIKGIKKFHLFHTLLSRFLRVWAFVNSRHLIRKNKRFENKHLGQECVILGNGISLESLDVKLLEEKVVFACNEIFLHPEIDKLRIDYFTIMEPYYGSFLGKAYTDFFLDLYSNVDRYFGKRDVQFFFHPSLKKFLKRRRLLQHADLNFVASLSVKKDNKSFDLSKSYHYNQGGLSMMIGAATYMGFKSIQLYGLGYSFSPRQQFHFYERPKYEKASYTYDEMMTFAQEFAEEKQLYVNSVDETEDLYLPVFCRDFEDDATAAVFKELNNLAQGQGISIYNNCPSGYESPIFPTEADNEPKQVANSFN